VAGGALRGTHAVAGGALRETHAVAGHARPGGCGVRPGGRRLPPRPVACRPWARRRCSRPAQRCGTRGPERCLLGSGGRRARSSGCSFSGRSAGLRRVSAGLVRIR